MISFKRKSETEIELAVGDDGIGMPAGFEARKAESLGIKIIHILAKQIDAVLKIETERGMRFVLALPIPFEGRKSGTGNRTKRD